MKILLFMLIPLVFFGAGVFFASLVWGKYKQLSEALRQKADRHAENEEKLQASLDKLQDEHASLSMTCRTLEEELAYIATERETLAADLEKCSADQGRIHQMEEELANALARCGMLEERGEMLQSEIDQLQHQSEFTREKTLAAENRARLMAAEKEEVLTLTGKLQAKLEQVGHLKEQPHDDSQAITALNRRLRQEGLRRRRDLRRSGVEDPRGRRQPRSRRAFSPAQPDSIEAGDPDSLRPESNDGPPRSAGMAKRFLTAATQFFPVASSNNSKRRSKKTVRSRPAQIGFRKRRL